MTHGFKFRIGDMVTGYTFGQDYRVIGRSDLGAGDFYALQKGAGAIYIREGKGLTLVPDPKLEAARKLVDACEAKTVAIQAFLVAAGHFYDPTVEAYRIIAESDSQKESN